MKNSVLIVVLCFWITRGNSQIPDCYSNVQYSYDSSVFPLPSGSISNVVLTWGMLPTGATPTSFDAYVGRDWNQLNYFGSTNTNSIDISSVANTPGIWYFQLAPKNDDGSNNFCSLLLLDLRIPPFNPPGGNGSEDCLNAVDVVSIEPTITTDDSWTIGQTSSVIDGVFCEEIGFVNGRSQWYKAIVPETGKLTVTAREVGNAHSLNIIVEVFEGDCSFYTELGCVLKYRLDDYSVTDMVNLTPGEQVFIRISIFETDPSLTSKSSNNKLLNPYEIAVHSQSLVLSNNEFDMEKSFSISPNPFETMLKINSQFTINSLSIYNLLGQELLFKEPLAKKYQMNLRSLDTGIYLIRINSEGKSKSYKIVKR